MRTPLFLGAALACALVTAAQADDIYSPTPFGGPMFTAPTARWGGFEFGLDLGGGAGSTQQYDASGLEGGGHIGVNYQMGPFVAGLEADALVSGVKADVGANSSISTNWLDSLRGKAGYAFGPWLVYGTLGGAYSAASYSTPLGTFNSSLNGWVFGVGGEYAFTPNISLRGELRRYLLSDATYYIPGAPFSGATNQTMGLFGISGRF